MAKHSKSQFVIYLEFIPFYLLYQLVHLLPLRVGMAISNALFQLFFLIDAKHRKRTTSHLLHAGVAKTPAEARKMARQTYREFSKLLIEIVKMDQCYHIDKVRFTGNQEAIDYFTGRDPGPHNGIVITAHYGNWEVAGTALSNLSGTPMVSIMRPFANPLIGELILNHRRSDVHTTVNKDNGLRALLKALHAGQHATVLIDQHASRSEGVLNTFFGHPCRTHMTPALLHLKTGVPIIPEMTRRRNDNFEFDLELGAPIRYTPTGNKEADILAITQMCTDALQKMIEKEPKQWLWAARRWLDINRGEYHPEPPTEATVPADNPPTA